MKLQITHLTEYRYSEPVLLGPHRLVLRPREGHDIHIDALQFTISPDYHMSWSRDVFGNSVAWLTFPNPADVLSIRTEVQLTRHPPLPARQDKAVEIAPFPVVYDPLESAVAAAYRATTYGEEADTIRQFLQSEGYLDPLHHALLASAISAGGAEGLLDHLNRRVHDLIAYNRRPEKGTQSPLQTLKRKSGSCRDIATLMMEMCRALGMAARFVSGYLDCPASTAGRASTHAWLEVYLPLKGWIGFDPTVGEHTSQKHIACGVSNHPRGVMPVAGTYTSTPTSTYLGLTVAVQITQLPAATSSSL